MKEVEHEPVEAAQFRTENIPFDMIMKTVTTVTSKLPLEKANLIRQKWDNKRESLERMARRRPFLPKMKILDLPKQCPEDLADITPLHREEAAYISGKLCDEEPEEGSLSEIAANDDVVVYTASKQRRPWVGRVRNVCGNGKFVLQWFNREGKTLRFKALIDPQGNPATEELDLQTVMFWSMSERRSETEFYLSNYWFTVIMKEYEEMDLRVKF